jgi:hypothetical protein
MERYSLAERKLVYRVLHAQLIDCPELIDTEFLHDLQKSLQQQALGEGIDVADHGAWDAWLGNTAVGCDVRVAARRIFSGN